MREQLLAVKTKSVIRYIIPEMHILWKNVDMFGKKNVTLMFLSLRKNEYLLPHHCLQSNPQDRDKVNCLDKGQLGRKKSQCHGFILYLVCFMSRQDFFSYIKHQQFLRTYALCSYVSIMQLESSLTCQRVPLHGALFYVLISMSYLRGSVHLNAECLAKHLPLIISAPLVDATTTSARLKLTTFPLTHGMPKYETYI
jgi:hypothetical protein